MSVCVWGGGADGWFGRCKCTLGEGRGLGAMSMLSAGMGRQGRVCEGKRRFDLTCSEGAGKAVNE